MSTFISKEVQAGLDAARLRSQKRSSRMVVEANGQTFRILRFWDTGFALEAEDAPKLRGFVDIYDRGFHMYQCLIVASEEENGQMIFEFKRLTAIQDVPPVDFVVDEPQTAGLLESKPTT